MKQGLLLSTVALMAICLLTSTTLAAIGGSAHDFSTSGWSQGQICLPCHTPHGGLNKDTTGNAIVTPIWNHTLSTNTSYKMYIAGAVTSGQNVDTNSQLCLSCHDGAVALDSFGGVTGNTKINGRSRVGENGDLTGSHPIGDAARWPTPNPAYMVDPALRNTAGIMPLRPMADGTLAVGCTSCHEPHNRKLQNNMLWVKNDGAATTVDNRAVSGSVLCMNCHKK